MSDYQCEEKGSDCSVKGPQVLRSAAGFYIGYYCLEWGPYDRVQTVPPYFPTEEVADRVLKQYKEIA